MKFLMLFFTLSTMPALAAECKLIGTLQSEQKIETSLVAASAKSCRVLAKNTKNNNFYGLVDKDDRLLETKMFFKEEETAKDVVSFDSEEPI